MTQAWPGIQVTVQSTHLDLFGHVNHARYLEYMEWARFAWAADHGFPLDQLVRERGMGPAILKAEVRFVRECRLGDVLQVTVVPTTARRGVGRLRQTLTDARTGERVCEAEMTFVMLDLTTRKAVHMPKELVEAMRSELVEGDAKHTTEDNLLSMPRE